MWLVGSKPIKLNATTPITSFSRVLRHRKFVAIGVNRYFLHKWHHAPCVMTSSIIPLLSILNIWSRGGVDSNEDEFIRSQTWSLYLATCWENLRSRDKLLALIGQKSPAKGGKMKHFPFYHIPYPDFSVVRLNITLRKILRPGQKSWSDRKNSSRAGI